MRLFTSPTLASRYATAQRADFVTNRGGYRADNQVVNLSTVLPALLHRFHPCGRAFCVPAGGSKPIVRELIFRRGKSARRFLICSQPLLAEKFEEVFELKQKKRQDI